MLSLWTHTHKLYSTISESKIVSLLIEQRMLKKDSYLPLIYHGSYTSIELT